MRSAFGWAYRSVWGYRLLMGVLYRGRLAQKYRAVAELVPPGSVVADLCAGDCAIEPLLRAKGCKYSAFDANPRFVEWAQRRGINAHSWDALNGAMPAADVILMQSSLYQFMDRAEALLGAMIAQARLFVIVSEPVENVTRPGEGMLSRAARSATVAQGRVFTERYDAETLRSLMGRIAGSSAELVSRGRDAVYVLRRAKP